ncbi:type III pantothenate kinase, partial [candidate division KSB1 bacterium]|nr:type III pantothenate kinase [candidate division KSB1 bacterium]
SVVPAVTDALLSLLRSQMNVEPLLVGAPGVELGIKVDIERPEEAGSDRIVNAVAGWQRYGEPLIIVDFGTATTCDAVSKKGEYLGGVIFPGIQISMEALFNNAAKLPRVELIVPDQVIGRSTIESIQSGAVHGFVGMIDGMVRKFREELGKKAKVIATGGIVEWIASQTKSIDVIDPFLTLDGLRIIYEKNRDLGPTDSHTKNG